MLEVERKFKQTAALYNKNQAHFQSCRALIDTCLALLEGSANFRHFGSYAGNPPVLYNVFENGNGVSRPVRPDLFISDRTEFDDAQSQILTALADDPATWDDNTVRLATSVIYTGVLSFACCIDLWKRSSRKTPGTFFEIYFAGLIPYLFNDAMLSKHITLPGISDSEEDELEAAEGEADGESSVATDLVIARPNFDQMIVIPLKITTRERIVQPFAHQRILDSAFGDGRYSSFLTCVSETQLDHKTQSVKQVCVPGTVKLFQRHLGQINGLYYCDVPQRYAADDMVAVLPVKEIGEIFRDFGRYFNA